MKKVIFKPENIFLIFCLLWGMIFICINPPFQSPDEPEHMFKMWGYTQGTYRYQIKDGWAGLEMPYSMASLYNFYNVYRFSNEKIPYKAALLSFNLPLAKETTTFLKHTPASYTPLSYFPSFLVLWAMKFFNVKPLCMMYILRFCSLLVYLALAYFAIKKTPCFKWMLWFFALLPINIYQAASLSTDSMAVGVILLFLSYTFLLAYDCAQDKISKKQVVIWGGMITLIGLLKFAYFPLILLYFLIPCTKFESIKSYFKNFILIFSINMLLIAGFFSTIFTQTGYLTYEQMHTLKSKFLLINEIITSPFAYIKTVFLSSIFLKNFLYQNVISSIGVTLAMIPLKYTHLAWLGLVCSLFYKTTKEKVCNINFKNKLLILAAVVLSFFLIMTSVYLIYQTKPYIVGVQGRYLTPLIPVVLLLVSFKKFNLQSMVIPIGLFLISQCLLFQNLLTLILRYY